MRPLCAALAVALLSVPVLAADPPKPADASVKIKPKERPRGEASESGSLLAPDTDNIDAPTAAVLDYGGYSSRTRFYAKGGLLEYVNFGVFQSLNLGASLTVDGLVGDDRTVRMRAPNAQVKYRFYDGDRAIPAFAVGYDGQGYAYNNTDKRYNHRQRGFYVVGTQELGLPGFEVHPSINISDFDTNSFFGSIPLSYNIRDKAKIMAEWDNINDFSGSRFNAGLRAYVTPHFHVDFAVRGIGQGGRFGNGDSRGPERIVQLRYSGNF
jgi:hypothetical protein